MPPGSTVLVKSLRSVQPTGPKLRRPVDLNGALGTLVTTLPSADGTEPRFQVVINDGTQVALKAQKLSLSIEKKGEMSAYARFQLNMAGCGELAADIGGYSSLSDSDDQGSQSSESTARSTARSAAFRRQRGLENIGEARRLEEGGRRAAGSRLYLSADAEDPDEEVLGSLVTLGGLVNNPELNGRRGRVLSRKSSDEAGEEARFVVELQSEGKAKELKVVKRRCLHFVDAREAWERDSAAHLGKGSGKGVKRVPPREKASPEAGQLIRDAAPPPGKEEPAASEGGAKPEKSQKPKDPKAKEGPKAPKAKAKPEPAFTAEDSLRLRSFLQQELAKLEELGTGSKRVSARQVEAGLRETDPVLLDGAQQYVQAIFKTRSKKQAKQDRKVGLTSRTHWLGRFMLMEQMEPCEAANHRLRFDFRSNAFCRGGADEDGSEADSDGDSEANEDAEQAEKSAELADEADEAGEAGEAEEAEASAAAPESAETPVAPEPNAVTEAIEATEAGVSVSRQPEQPELSTRQLTAEAASEIESRAEPIVSIPHRFYGSDAGRVFFIPTWQLYFTQDSIKSGFKDSASGASSGYSSGDGAARAHRPLTTSVREMFDAIIARSMRKREVEMMDVVYHEGYYYSICNRRLAVYLLLWLCGRCPRLKVQLVDKGDRHVNWGRRFTTGCDGEWIVIRQTGEVIGRRFEDTTFKHPLLESSKAGLQSQGRD